MNSNNGGHAARIGATDDQERVPRRETVLLWDEWGGRRVQRDDEQRGGVLG
ncbi:MAG TPA: hypothetical protein VF734_11260 [Pseudonocardiaceae bacterium]|jgi:hypothetical protein